MAETGFSGRNCCVIPPFVRVRAPGRISPPLSNPRPPIVVFILGQNKKKLSVPVPGLHGNGTGLNQIKRGWWHVGRT